MQIVRLHIENFGKLKDLDLDFKAGLTVICAENGWGKSTLAAFIKAMFYGLDYTTKRALRENERKRYLPWQGGAYGGNMEFFVGSKRYRVERFFGTKDKADTFALYDLDTGLMSKDYSAHLGEELFGVNRAAYERSSFFIQQDFMVSISDSLNVGLTHAKQDMGDLKNYEKAIASLESQMKYYQKTGNRGWIGKLEEEQRTLREELSECRRQEAAVEQWNVQLQEKEQELQGLLTEEQELTKEVHLTQDYEKMEAKRVQYDRLRKEAEACKEELQQTAAELGEFVTTPPKEDDLDRCREHLYQMDALRQQEEHAAGLLQEASHRLSLLEEDLDTPFYGLLTGVLAGLLPVLGVFLLLRGVTLAGTVLLAVGLVVLLAGGIQSLHVHRQMEKKKQQRQKAEEDLQKCERDVRSVRKNREALKKKVCRFLKVSDHTDVQELERIWRQSREDSRRYMEIKLRYETRRKEASKSRELWFQYGDSLSEEERTYVLASGVYEAGTQDVQKRLHDCEKKKESLLKEKQGIHQQVLRLLERAEQIPALEEEELRLSKQIQDALHEHEILEKTIQYLKTAREQFSMRYLKELQQCLDQYLRLLAPEEEPGVSLDVKLHLKVQESGALRELEYFSTGWKDLFYIAERLAIVDVLYKEARPMLIMDDPFVNLDEKKEKRVHVLLEQLAEKGQILYFTCKEAHVPVV